jgi:hypothetical protein
MGNGVYPVPSAITVGFGSSRLGELNTHCTHLPHRERIEEPAARYKLPAKSMMTFGSRWMWKYAPGLASARCYRIRHLWLRPNQSLLRRFDDCCYAWSVDPNC